jgi:hypothetical protein
MPRTTKYKEKIKLGMLNFWVKGDLYPNLYPKEKPYTIKSQYDLFTLLDESLETLFPKYCTNEWFGKIVDVKDVDKFIKGEW